MKFNFDNPFFTGLAKLLDTMLLSIVWFVCCIPIFTIGAASTAMYYATHKSLRRNRGYLFTSYWQSFKSNFLQATFSWLIQLFILVVIGIDMYLLNYLNGQGSSLGLLFYVFVVMLALMIVWIQYTFAYQARFENTLKNTLKNAGLIAFGNLPWSLLVLVLFVVSAYIIYLLPILLFFVPAALYLLYDLILERVFRKYMSPEDLAKEQENDMLDRE